MHTFQQLAHPPGSWTTLPWQPDSVVCWRGSLLLPCSGWKGSGQQQLLLCGCLHYIDRSYKSWHDKGSVCGHQHSAVDQKISLDVKNALLLKRDLISNCMYVVFPIKQIHFSGYIFIHYVTRVCCKNISSGIKLFNFCHKNTFSIYIFTIKI